jgi:hypothetical protein
VQVVVYDAIWNESEEMLWGSGFSVASSLIAEDINHSDE